MKHIRILFGIGLFCSLFLMSSTGFAQYAQKAPPAIVETIQGGDQPESFFSYMHHQELLSIELHTDLKSLIINKRKNDYQDAKIRFVDKEGTPFEGNVKVRPRGKSRRKNM